MNLGEGGIGGWLEQQRINVGKSRAQVGEDGGIHKRTVERVETGHYGDPRWSTIARILAGIGVSGLEVNYETANRGGHVQPTLDHVD